MQLYICNHEDNVPSWWSPQWLCGNSCTLAHDVQFILVITRRAHCFHDCIYITPILLLWVLSTLRVADHLWPLILRSFLSLLRTLCNRTSRVQVHELPQSHCGDSREGTLFSWLFSTISSKSFFAGWPSWNSKGCWSYINWNNSSFWPHQKRILLDQKPSSWWFEPWKWLLIC